MYAWIFFELLVLHVAREVYLLTLENAKQFRGPRCIFCMKACTNSQNEIWNNGMLDYYVVLGSN